MRHQFSGFGDLPGFQAFRTNAERPWTSVNDNPHLMNVRRPAPLCLLM